MKFLAVCLSCMLMVAPLCAEPPGIKEIKVHLGTLTLVDEGIDFEYGGKKIRHGFSQTMPGRSVWVPGYGTVHIPTKQEREQLPLEYGSVRLRGSNGSDTIVLEYEKPVTVVRMEIDYLRSDSDTLWKLLPPSEIPVAAPQ